MAAKSNDVPPIPVPPPGSGVPPVEPPPATPPAPADTPAAPSPAVPPTPPDPYASPAAPAPGNSQPAPGQPAPYGHPAPGAAAAPPGQQPYGQSPYGQPGYTPPPAGPAQGLSIASMILGIGGLVLSLFGLGLLAAIAAVITGHMAQKRQPWAKAFWMTGIITGYVGLAISVVFGAILVFAIIAGVLATSGAYFG
ncbi:MAG: hypothetical protein JWP85_1811 [Rhodoglobus sp.]|nr:hypothetical protein [Rhodoglobus sp.]